MSRLCEKVFFWGFLKGKGVFQGFKGEGYFFLKIRSFLTLTRILIVVEVWKFAYGGSATRQFQIHPRFWAPATPWWWKSKFGHSRKKICAAKQKLEHFNIVWSNSNFNHTSGITMGTSVKFYWFLGPKLWPGGPIFDFGRAPSRVSASLRRDCKRLDLAQIWQLHRVQRQKVPTGDSFWRKIRSGKIPFWRFKFQKSWIPDKFKAP